MPIVDFVTYSEELLGRIRKVAPLHHYLMFETTFQQSPAKSYMVDIVSEVLGSGDQGQALRALFLSYLVTNSRPDQWHPILTGAYQGVSADVLDAETRNVLIQFVPQGPTRFTFQQGVHLVQENPAYGHRAGHPQAVPVFGGDLSRGVCLALCYDWVLRLLGGASLSPMADGIPQNVLSMQRAYKQALANGLSTNQTWLPMLAKQDGLSCTSVEWTNQNRGFGEEARVLGAWDAFKKLLGDQPAILALHAHDNAIAHAIGLWAKDGQWLLFDPNHGQFQLWSAQSFCTSVLLLLRYEMPYFKMCDHGYLNTFAGIPRPALVQRLLAG
jgi:hypothetical protein